ncbi:ladderlectin-like isoform X1 [Epinephelus fuscoguttatus]|uniref:ladderlectin-like isoform X1 n=1 Tax=Epinephelus fuscoguttatus TaxID=293821 RepID=UPI0020D05DE6|nr:ladderlectin-like isoform X1 [Epinephelus fuscoguttatus]
MKTVLVLSILLCAAFAAPQPEGEKTNEAKAPEAAVEVLKEEVVAAPEMDKMMKDEEVLVPEEFVPVPRNAPVSEEAAAPESRFNFCPRGWLQHGSRCFVVISTSKTWYSAKEHCNILGAHLASATNTAEYSFLQQMTQLHGLTSTWLGGLYLQGQWMWIDQEGFTSLYSLPSPSSYPCIYLRSNHGWCNTGCGTAFPFICSKIPENC